MGKHTCTTMDGHYPGPSCSKVSMSLVNLPLKCQMLIPQIRQYFLLKKFGKLLHCKSFSHFFSKKNNSVFSHRVVKHLQMVSLIYFIVSEINILIKFR